MRKKMTSEYDIKTYAPVIIPTLCRYECFKNCLESLEKCSGADNTPVYIGLDYPPSAKYEDGWRKIDEYLKQKETKNHFLKLTVIRRDTNCGVGGPTSNSVLLANYVQKEYDRFIFSEDDNIFAPNFLDYINKGLDLFENDDRVFCICGYTQPYPFKYDENTYFFHRTDMSAWGYGIWSTRYAKFKEDVLNGFFEKNKSLKNLFKVKKYGLNRLFQYITYVFRNKDRFFRLTDCVMTNYVILNEMFVVNPVKSKVKNMGWDSQGASFEKKPKILKKYGSIPERHRNQIIDDERKFEFIGDPLNYAEYNDMVTERVSEAKISLMTFVKLVVKFFVKRMIQN